MAIVSSHTLNGVDGSHAGGIAVKLVNMASGAVVFQAEMDEGGRLRQEVDPSRYGGDDMYELVFATGPYWASRGIGETAIEEVVLRFRISDPEGTYHRPIILSPNGYSTWASA